jgi:hypothetical protein
MSAAQYLCLKIKEMISNDEVIGLDELTTEMEGLDLEAMCPELKEYLDKVNEQNR